MKDYSMENPRAKNIKRKLFLNLDVKNPSTETLEYINNQKLPSSGYLNKNTRSKILTELTIDQLEYVAFNCKQCPEFLKLKALVVYFIKLFNKREENNITEDEFNLMVDEYIAPYTEPLKEESIKLKNAKKYREDKEEARKVKEETEDGSWSLL